MNRPRITFFRTICFKCLLCANYDNVYLKYSKSKSFKVLTGYNDTTIQNMKIWKKKKGWETCQQNSSWCLLGNANRLMCSSIYVRPTKGTRKSTNAQSKSRESTHRFFRRRLSNQNAVRRSISRTQTPLRVYCIINFVRNCRFVCWIIELPGTVI